MFLSDDDQAIKECLNSLPQFLDEVGRALDMKWSSKAANRNVHPSATGVANPNIEDDVASPEASLSRDGFGVELDDECYDTANNHTPGSALPFSGVDNIPVNWLSFRYFFKFYCLMIVICFTLSYIFLLPTSHSIKLLRSRLCMFPNMALKHQEPGPGVC